MEVLIGVVILFFILFIVYRNYFGEEAKEKSLKSIVEATVRLGVPRVDVSVILATEMPQLSVLLAGTALPHCTISNLPVHERMAHCIKIIYDKEIKTK